MPVLPLYIKDKKFFRRSQVEFPNYSGFYFDPAKSLGDETLLLYSIEGRRISSPFQIAANNENNNAGHIGLWYTTILQPKDFEFNLGDIISS